MPSQALLSSCPWIIQIIDAHLIGYQWEAIEQEIEDRRKYGGKNSAGMAEKGDSYREMEEGQISGRLLLYEHVFDRCPDFYVPT